MSDNFLGWDIDYIRELAKKLDEQGRKSREEDERDNNAKVARHAKNLLDAFEEAGFTNEQAFTLVGIIIEGAFSF